MMFASSMTIHPHAWAKPVPMPLYDPAMVQVLAATESIIF
jgi:hypothetical protein